VLMAANNSSKLSNSRQPNLLSRPIVFQLY
jgi:hypothetical protein